MTFISFGYIFVFLPVVLFLYHRFRTSGVANVVILLASYYFYGSSGVFLLIPLIISSWVDFYVGHKLDETENERHRKILLALSIVANMSILVFFKYATWAMQSANMLLEYFNISHAFPVVDIPMLPGVSFYTFQTMSYTIDVYRREMKASRHLTNYMAFVTFWPHLVAGPIMRAKNLLQQIETIRPPVTAEQARFAVMLIAWGFFKKLVIADNFGFLVESMDSQVRGNNLWSGLGFLYAYAFAGQIYCDFSAYTSMARGSAKLIGIELPRNFLTPYFSLSPSDFWRRWHISLSTWLRDYIYIPLGGNRHGKLKQYRNLIITMFLGGLWHGAGILFIFWGIWHGFLLVLYRLIPIEETLSRMGKPGRVLLMLIMFNLICFGWLLFRSDVTTFLPLWHTLTHLGGLMTIQGNLFYYYGWAIALLWAIVGITDYIGFRAGGEFEDHFVRLGNSGMVIMLAFCYFAVVLLAKREGAQFVYFQF